MKILGIGVDIVENIRIHKSLKNVSFIKRVFSSSEISIAKNTTNKKSYYSKRFAAKEAFSKAIGTGFRENLNFRDGFFINDEKHQLEIIKILRKYRPEIVLCNAEDDRHIDHPKGAKLVSDACFLSGLRKIITKIDDLTQGEWRPKNVYHYIQWKNSNPDFLVDISGHIKTKTAAINAYSSQFFDPNSSEPETPISNKNFISNVINRSADLGRLINVGHAEGFTSKKLLGVNSLQSLI